MNLGKLGLGAAQFGMSYGITNHDGQTPPAEVDAILRVAEEAGVDLLDTAHLYGNSESVLGDTTLSSGFRVVTKTTKMKGNLTTNAQVLTELERWRRAMDQSLARLRRPAAYALLAHESSDLLGPAGDGLVRLMVDSKRQGLFEKVGFSAYTPNEVDTLLDRYPELTIIQVPLNVLDQRFLASGTLGRAKRAGVEVHTRSVFLQGSLLVPTTDLPPVLRDAAAFANFQAAAAAHGATPLGFALDFALRQEVVDKVIIGVTCSAELVEIIAQANNRGADINFSNLSCNDERIIFPTNW